MSDKRSKSVSKITDNIINKDKNEYRSINKNIDKSKYRDIEFGIYWWEVGGITMKPPGAEVHLEYPRHRIAKTNFPAVYKNNDKNNVPT